MVSGVSLANGIDGSAADTDIGATNMKKKPGGIPWIFARACNGRAVTAWPRVQH